MSTRENITTSVCYTESVCVCMFFLEILHLCMAGYFFFFLYLLVIVSSSFGIELSLSFIGLLFTYFFIIFSIFCFYVIFFNSLPPERGLCSLSKCLLYYFCCRCVWFVEFVPSFTAITWCMFVCVCLVCWLVCLCWCVIGRLVSCIAGIFVVYLTSPKLLFFPFLIVVVVGAKNVIHFVVVAQFCFVRSCFFSSSASDLVFLLNERMNVCLFTLLSALAHRQKQ